MDTTFIEHHQTYTKINTLYKRDSSNKNKIIVGEFSLKEIEYLYDNLWSCEEKIDGTNIHYYWNGHVREFHGKTESADIPKHLLTKLDELFPIEKLKEIFPIKTDEHRDEIPFEVRIYGDGYGVILSTGVTHGICELHNRVKLK